MKHLLLFCRICPVFVFTWHLPLSGHNSDCAGSLSADSFLSFLRETPNTFTTALIIGSVIIVILILLILFLCYRIHCICSRIRLIEYRAAKRILLIRSLLDIGYVYSESPQVFFEKFKDKINIRQLKPYDLIDLSDKKYAHLKEDERFLCALLDNGFTHRELCAVYNMKSVGNLYVKYHRIKAKLKQGINRVPEFKYSKKKKI